MARPYSGESLDRALDAHRSGGMIEGWRHGSIDPDAGERPGRRVVDVTGGGEVELRSDRETFVFVLGITTARQAAPRTRVPEGYADRVRQVHTIVAADVGRHIIGVVGDDGAARKVSLRDALGRVQAGDVGRRVYRVLTEHGWVLQVESTQQRDARLTTRRHLAAV